MISVKTRIVCCVSNYAYAIKLRKFCGNHQCPFFLKIHVHDLIPMMLYM